MTEIWTARGWAVDRGHKIHKKYPTVTMGNHEIYYVGEGWRLLANWHTEQTFLYGRFFFFIRISLPSGFLLSSFSQGQ